MKQATPVLSSALASSLADGIGRSAIPLLASAMTKDPFAVSLVTAFSFLPYLLFGIPIGMVVDHSPRRVVMALANATRAVVLAAAAVGIVTEVMNIWFVYLLAALLAVTECAYDAAMEAIVPQVVETPEELIRTNSRLQMIVTSMNDFVGAPIGGFLFSAALAAPFAANAAFFLLSVGLLMLMTRTVGARSVQLTLEATGEATEVNEDKPEGHTARKGADLSEVLGDGVPVVSGMTQIALLDAGSRSEATTSGSHEGEDQESAGLRDSHTAPLLGHGSTGAPSEFSDPVRTAADASSCAEVNPGCDDTREDSVGSAESLSGMWSAALDGIRLIWSDSILRMLVILTAIMGFSVEMGQSTFVLYAEMLLGLSPFGYSVLTMMFAVGGFSGAWLSPKLIQRLGRVVVMRLALLTSLVSVLLIAVSSSPWLTGPVIAVFAAAAALWNVNSVTLRQIIVPSNLYGRVYGGWRTVTYSVLPLGAALGGVIGGWWGLRASWLGAGVAFLAASVMTWQMTKSNGARLKSISVGED